MIYLGVTLELSPLSKRIYALLIDTLLISFVILTTPALGFTGAIYISISVAALLLYDPLCVARSGQTIGHRILGIKVVKNNGDTPSLFQAFGRWIVKGVLGLWSFVTMMANGKAVHDMLSKTQVILVTKK
jgi:uncharacterized RDD family membrane protein YckC